jgi:tripartite-type tricarboxylate transporter receptor subunit TctC
MKPTRRLTSALLLGTAAMLMLPHPGAAQDYPSRPIELIVPWSAGGGTDATGRMVAELLSQALGQPINVVNRTGGGGVVGHTEIANAAPDGYTLGVITTELSMFNHAGTSPVSHENFSPIALYNQDPVALHVAASSDITDAASLVAAISAAPGSFNASGANFGGVAHLGMVGFVLANGLSADSVAWIPSEGSAPSLQELAAGTVQIVSTTLPEAASMVSAGEARVVGVLSDARLASAPDVATMAEQTGNAASFGAWRGIAGPAGLPDDVVARLSEAMAQVVADPAFTEFMAGRGFGVSFLPADGFDAFLAARDDSFGAAMKAAGLGQ